MPGNLSQQRRVGRENCSEAEALFRQRLSGRQSFEEGGAVLCPALYIAERRAWYEVGLAARRRES